MRTQTDTQCCVIINSIGSATPSAVGAVAKGLGLSAEETIRSVYRAPFVLAREVEKAVADQLTGLLAKLGFESSIAAQREITLTPNELFDVVVRIDTPHNTLAIAEEVAKFCGIGLPDAMRVLFTPPGLVLGGVSDATTTALRDRVEALGAKVIASRPHHARYDLFAADLSRPLLQRLKSELGQSGSRADDVFAADLSYAEANRLWQSYGRSGKVAIIDRSFQHFEIVMETIEPDGDDDARAACLEELFGIPPKIYSKLANAGEVVLGDACDYSQIDSHISRLFELGIKARAELATFAQRALSIDGLEAKTANEILIGFGVPSEQTSLPITAPPLPLAMARGIHATVRAAGGRASFVEDAHG